MTKRGAISSPGNGNDQVRDTVREKHSGEEIAEKLRDSIHSGEDHACFSRHLALSPQSSVPKRKLFAPGAHRDLEAEIGRYRPTSAWCAQPPLEPQGKPGHTARFLLRSSRWLATPHLGNGSSCTAIRAGRACTRSDGEGLVV